MVIDDYILYLHSFDNDKPMLIEHEYNPGECAENAIAVAGLARKAQQPNGGRLFAGQGVSLLRTAA